MMMRQIVTYLIAALTLNVIISVNPALSAAVDDPDLAKLVSQYHDNHMTVNDLAFFLTTHNFDATPKDGYVQITINGQICKAKPNSETGYAELDCN